MELLDEHAVLAFKLLRAGSLGDAESFIVVAHMAAYSTVSGEKGLVTKVTLTSLEP